MGFQQHQRTHTGDLFSCKVCGEKFQSKHSASRHEKDLHGVFGQLKDNEEKILKDLIECQGPTVDVGGYYKVDPTKAAAAMRPSKVFNDLIDKF